MVSNGNVIEEIIRSNSVELSVDKPKVFNILSLFK